MKCSSDQNKWKSVDAKSSVNEGCRNQKPTLKQIYKKTKKQKNKTKKKQQKTKTKKLLDVEVSMLEINKSELKTNETLITQVTNALFSKVD